MRDDESETQRKAHAKRVRETRRSTQGVTLDEIKSAEQLVKKKADNGTETVAPKKDDTTATDTLVCRLVQYYAFQFIRVCYSWILGLFHLPSSTAIETGVLIYIFF